MEVNNINTNKGPVCRKHRTGGIIPLVAFSLVAILAVGGLAVEYARLQLARTELRAISDNVSRSCATELLLTDSQVIARERGMSIAARYKVANSSFALKDTDIVFGKFTNNTFIPNATPPNAVRVNSARKTGSVSGQLNLIFGSMFGVRTADVQTFACSSFRMVDICFVLDRSSSMKLSVFSNAAGLSMLDPRAGTPPWPDSRWSALDTAFDGFINEIDTNAAEERIGMVSFASDFTGFGVTNPASSIDLDLTSNASLASAKMSELSASVWNGMTYIEAGMQDGIKILTTSVNHRANAEKVLVVLTDGHQNQGEARNAATAAVASNITIHTITFGDFADQALMREIATMGGGDFAHASNAAGLKQIMKDLASSLTALVE